MNKALIKEWVEALRSDSYHQWCGGDLKNADSYCCLGVLACVKGKNDVDEVKAEDAEYLDKTFLEEIDLLELDQEELARMNDEKISFKTISDFIEAKYLKP